MGLNKSWMGDVLKARVKEFPGEWKESQYQYLQYLRKEAALVYNCPQNSCQEGTKCTKVIHEPSVHHR